MIRDAQIDPMSRRLMHVDFLRVSLDDEVHVTVPLVLTGKAVGVTNGGNLHQSMHAIAIAAKPAAIPSKLEADVTALEIGTALHVSDLKLGAGVRALLDPKEAIASVVAPKVPMACIANPCAGRSSGCPRVASSSCASSMTARKPASSSSGSSYPGPSSLDEIDNLVYRPYQTT